MQLILIPGLVAAALMAQPPPVQESEAPPPAQPTAAPQPAAQPATPQNPPVVQPGSDPLAEPLTPDELVVPSNRALAATAPAPSVAAAPAQPQPLTPGKGGVFTMKAEVDEVVLHATVVDEHRRLVTDLGRDAFEVYEDGREQPITSFRHEDVPVAVGIIVDDSGSMREKRPAVEQAALNFVRASNPQDRVFVVNFSDPQDIYIDADFTASIPRLKQALENIDSRGETALYDAVAASADYVMTQKGIDHPLSKRVLLVITDGWDDASRLSLEQCVRRVAVEGGPTIYTIGLLDPDYKRKGKRALRALADSTGGVAYFLDPADLGKVDEVTQEIARDIRNQYTIGYKPQPGGGAAYRSIRAEAHAPRYHALQVRTRSGYYPGEERASE